MTNTTATTTPDHRAEKKQSYRNRVTRGQQVRIRRDVNAAIIDLDTWTVIAERTFPAGTVAVVNSEQNAGERGIEASVSFPGGFRANVSTGAIR